MANDRLKIAIQKKGRLYEDSMELLKQCGLKIKPAKSDLFCHAENMPVDVLFVRDDDIPVLVRDQICDVGIVGENVLKEFDLAQTPERSDFEVIKKLGFGRCRLSIALQQTQSFHTLEDLHSCKIATSYPNLLRNYIQQHQLQAEVLTISGSVEIAPGLNMASAICDLVSTGKTLEENNLKEAVKILDSQAVYIKAAKPVAQEKRYIYELMLSRIHGVIKASGSKYVMFHAPRSAVPELKHLLPGSETPTTMALEGSDDKVAVHVVTTEGVFWQTLEALKAAGASSILVMPIEKMLT